MARRSCALGLGVLPIAGLLLGLLLQQAGLYGGLFFYVVSTLVLLPMLIVGRQFSRERDRKLPWQVLFGYLILGVVLPLTAFLLLSFAK